MSAVLKTRTVIPLGDAGLGFIIAIDEDNGLFDALTGYKIKMDPLSVVGRSSHRTSFRSGSSSLLESLVEKTITSRNDLRIRHIDCDFPAAIIIDAEVSLTVGITRWVDETRNAEDHL